MNGIMAGGPGTPVTLRQDDFEVVEREARTSTATALLIDMSRSMYYSGAWDAAKRAALALDTLIRGKYPRDMLELIGFSSVAQPLLVAQRDLSTPESRAGAFLGFLPYFPLLSGILTGKYRKGQPLPRGTRVTGNERWESLLTEETLDLIERLVAFSEERGHELLDLAFAWLLAENAVSSVIAGATSAAQVQRNARTAEWVLTEEEKAQVDALLTEVTL